MTADWTIFGRAWREFKKEPLGWLTAAFLTCAASGALGLLSRIPYVIAGLKLRDLPWHLRFVDLTIVHAIQSASFYWLCCTAVATIDSKESNRKPLQEAIKAFPQILVASLVVSIPLTVVYVSFDGLTSFLISLAFGYAFVLFEPLMALRRTSPLRAIFSAPVLLIRSPRHTFLFFVAYLLGLVGILACGVGLLVTIPLSYIATLLALQDLTSSLDQRSVAD